MLVRSWGIPGLGEGFGAMLRKYPALFFLAFVVAGIVCADLTRPPSGVFLFIALLAVLASALAAYRLTIIAPVLFGISLASVSAYHYAIEHYDLTPRHIARVVDESRTVQIFGRVSDWPDLKTYGTDLKVDVDSLGGNVGKRVEGTILVKVTDTTTALQRGDRVEFWARIYPVEGGENGGERFDYKRYLHLKGVFGLVYLPTLLDVRIDKRYEYGLFAVVDHLRDAIRNSFYDNLSPDAAALASGFLIGETRDIPTHVYQWFRDSGTLHLLAVSGSNVALVLLVIAYLLRPFGLSRRGRAVVLLVVIVLFGLLSYGEPSVIRASVMAALVIMARLLERRFDLNHIIAQTMLIILLWDPAQMYDVGFQLSFGTAWGLIFFVPRITPLFEPYHNRSWYRYLAFPLIISFVAQIFSTPLTLFYFGRFPVWTLAANLVIVPLVSVAVIGVMILLTASLLSPVLGSIAGVGLDLIMRLTIKGVEFFGGGSHAVLQFDAVRSGRWNWLLMVAIYLLLTLAGFAIAAKRGRRLVVIALLLVLNFILGVSLIRGWTPRPETLTVMRVPGGLGALHFSPDWKQADLILTGLAAKDYALDERVLQPILAAKGIKSIRYLFVLKSSFMAIDDALRLGRNYGVDTILAPLTYRQAFLDAIEIGSLSDSVSCPISFFPSEQRIGPGDGYFPSDRGLLVRRTGQSIYLSNENELAPLSPYLPQGCLVVLGSTWKPTEMDLAELRRVGAIGLICARIAHVRPGREGEVEKQLLFDPPCPVYDLSAQDELVVRFTPALEVESP
jgi:ComEC/Rec2-related protein